MEHEQQHHHHQQPAPLECPRCGSLDTKFRYFNNNSRSQPRHYCKSCKRQWTVGGNLRKVPVGGKTRSVGRATKAASSSTQWLSTGEEQHWQSPTMDAYYDFNDEISCLDAIQSLIHPQISANHLINGAAYMPIPQQHNNITTNMDSFQTCNESINVPSLLYTNDMNSHDASSVNVDQWLNFSGDDSNPF